MCNEKYLSLKLNDVEKGKNSQQDNEIRLLKLENTNFKNQITSLKNVIQKLESGNANAENSIDYKDKFEKLLKNFENQLEIQDGKVIDPYAGVRPVFICNL